MNRRRIKEITDGAALLGIYGGLLVLNRFLLANFFNVIIFIFLSTIVLFYNIRNPKSDLRWGILIGCLLLSFIFGDIYIFIFAPLGIILGGIFYYSYTKTQDKLIILGCLFLAAIIYEIVATIFVLPIFGIPLELDLEGFKNMYNSFADNFGSTLVLSDNLILIIVVLSIVLTGVMEAYIAYLSSILVLKFCKLKQPIKKHLILYRPNKILSYLAFFVFSISFYNLFILNYSDMALFWSCLCIVGAVVLLCYGYIACVVSLKVFLKKEAGILFGIITFLLIPYFVLPLIFIGFLYGAGPLRELILRKGNYEKT